MSEAVKQANENVFVAQVQQRGLRQSFRRTVQADNNSVVSQGTAKRQASVLFNDIVKSVCLPHLSRSKITLASINQDAELMSQYLWVLNKVAISTSLSQVAASTTNTIFNRTTDVFELKIKPDPVHVNQAYVILTLLQPRRSHHNEGVNLHCYVDKQYTVVSFPSIVTKDIGTAKTQILLATSSLDYKVLVDPETQITLT